MKIKTRGILGVRGKPEEATLLTLKVEDRVMSQEKKTTSKFLSIVLERIQLFNLLLAADLQN